MKSGSRASGMPRISPGVLKVFAAYSRRYVRRHFHSVRLSKSGTPPADRARPLVIYLNHASWWDPLVCLLLAQRFFADRKSFAPIDDVMLQRYAFFKHLGFFGIDPAKARGGWHFIRTTRQILASSQNALWLTPQGRFMDVRTRPLRFQPGLGALAAREPEAAFIPLAIEIAFWTEPRPEILVSFGDAIVPSCSPARTVAEWTHFFSESLTTTQNALALSSGRRDGAEWISLDRGKSGVNSVYDAWRWLRGEKFSAGHLEEVLP